MKIRDRVLINMPLYGSSTTKTAARREYNHKVAMIIETIDKGYYRLDVDEGRFVWPKSMLAKYVPTR